MEEKKRWRMTFYSGRKRRTQYVSCAESEVQGEKERWAVFLEEQTGLAWHCTGVTEVKADNLYIGDRKGGD